MKDTKSSATTVAAGSRTAFIDHIRIVLTVLVVLHHVAIIYGGSGGWYWRQEPNASSKVLLFFNALNQSYFMGFFFLLAGYFTPPSFDKKGARRFLLDRLVRLGIPLLVYYFLISPFTIALGDTADGKPLGNGFLVLVRAHVGEPGPLWFAEALLILGFLYAGWRAIFRGKRDEERAPNGWPSAARLAAAAIGTGLIAFALRLQVPVGENVFHLQLGYFPEYVVLFVFGCWASRARLLEKVAWTRVKPFLILSLAAIATLPVMIALPGLPGRFEGGWSIKAIYYALWDPLVAWGVMGGYLYWFREFRPKLSAVSASFARNAYGAYIIHPPVVVALAVFARTVNLAPLLKFGVVGALAALASFAIGSLLLRIPGARHVL